MEIEVTTVLVVAFRLGSWSDYTLNQFSDLFRRERFAVFDVGAICYVDKLCCCESGAVLDSTFLVGD
jgi:hypothetical protein